MNEQKAKTLYGKFKHVYTRSKNTIKQIRADSGILESETLTII